METKDVWSSQPEKERQAGWGMGEKAMRVGLLERKWPLRVGGLWRDGITVGGPAGRSKGGKGSTDCRAPC